MTDDFKNWLDKHSETKAEYDNNPEWRDDIYIDYQKETAFKDFDTWLQWALENEEVAREYFPHIMEMMDEAVNRSSDFNTALLIKKIAEGFVKWKKEANELIGSAKRKMIERHVNLNKRTINSFEHNPKIVQDTILNYKDELEDNLRYWTEELAKLEANEETPITSHSEIEQKIISLFDAHKGWEHYFDKEKDFKQLLELLQLNLSGFEYSLPSNLIQTKKRTKTDLGNLLGRIHKELSTVKTLRSDHKFIEIIKSIDSFKDEKNVYRALTRDR
jgi:hypothetical protein